MQLQKLQRQVSAQLSSTPLLESIARGTVTRAQYRTYLSDAYFYSQHSAHVVAHAGIRLANFQPRLSRYMAHRAVRRFGHHEAALADLHDLGLTEDDFMALRPSSPCLRMIALQYYYAKEDNPVGVLGWMFVLQSLGGQIGSDLAGSLDRGLGLKGSAMRFLVAHEGNRFDLMKLGQLLESGAFDADDGECFARSAKEAADLYCGILDVAYAASETRSEKPRAERGLLRRLH